MKVTGIFKIFIVFFCSRTVQIKQVFEQKFKQINIFTCLIHTKVLCEKFSCICDDINLYIYL